MQESDGKNSKKEMRGERPIAGAGVPRIWGPASIPFPTVFDTDSIRF